MAENLRYVSFVVIDFIDEPRDRLIGRRTGVTDIDSTPVVASLMTVVHARRNQVRCCIKKNNEGSYNMRVGQNPGPFSKTSRILLSRSTVMKVRRDVYFATIHTLPCISYCCNQGYFMPAYLNFSTLFSRPTDRVSIFRCSVSLTVIEL